MTGGPTVFCPQVTSCTFLIQTRKIAWQLQHTATSFIMKECKHRAHGENVYNKYSWSAFRDNLREMSVIFIFPTVCKIFLNAYYRIEPHIYRSLTHSILYLLRGFRSNPPPTESMGLSWAALWVRTRSENSTGIKTYIALTLEVKGTILFPQTGIPEILNQLFLYLANQLWAWVVLLKKKKIIASLILKPLKREINTTH